MSDPLIVNIPAEMVTELETLAEYYNLLTPAAVLTHGVSMLRTFKKFGDLNADVAVIEANGAVERVNIYPSAR